MLRSRLLFKLIVGLFKISIREPIAIFFTLLMPVMLLIMMGFIMGDAPVPELEGPGHVDMNVPGYAALIIGIMGIAGVPIETVTRRETGVLRRFRATPLRPLEYVVGDALAGFAMMMMGVTVLFLLGRFGYGAPFHGNVLALIAGVSLSACAFLSLGYVLAGILPSVRVATVVGNVLVYPMVILSGSVVPQQLMPETVQNVARFVPLTHVVTLLRGLWLGNHMADHLLEITVLLGIIILSAPVAARMFRWE